MYRYLTTLADCLQWSLFPSLPPGKWCWTNSPLLVPTVTLLQPTAQNIEMTSFQAIGIFALNVNQTWRPLDIYHETLHSALLQLAVSPLKILERPDVDRPINSCYMELVANSNVFSRCHWHFLTYCNSKPTQFNIILLYYRTSTTHSFILVLIFPLYMN